MGALKLSEAFAEYGAKLVSPQWAVSAVADNGALVMSCWRHYFKRVDAVLRYEDTLSRWSANAAGNALFKQHIEDALKNKRPVRLVIAKTDDRGTVDSGQDASKAKKEFYCRPEMIGRITHFDGDTFIIDFQREINTLRII
jgi:hypothetical protein